MNINKLKSDIKDKTVKHYLLFSGSEWMIQSLYIKQIAKVFNKKVKYIDTLDDIFSKVKNNSFLSDSFVYVVRDDKSLLQDKGLQDSIVGTLKDNFLIHILTSVDKRTSFYKQFQEDIIEFESLSDNILKKYVRKEVNLSDKNCDFLIQLCEHDYGRILLEIDKIKIYSDITNLSYDQSFEKLIDDGTIYVPAYSAVFDFVDAVMQRNVSLAFDLLFRCREEGETTLGILSALYGACKHTLQVQSCDSKDVVSVTGLTSWQINLVRSYLNKYRIGELVYMLKFIQKMESGIKSGKVEESYTVEYLLVNIF